MSDSWEKQTAQPTVLRWQYSGPIWSDPVLRYETVLSLGLLFLFAVAAGLGLGWLEHWTTGLAAFLLIGLLVVAAVWLTGNRHEATFEINEHGAFMFALLPGGSAAANTIGAVGQIPGQPEAVAIASTAESAARKHILWPALRKVTIDQEYRIISLWNAWLPRVRLWCHPDNFEAAVALVAKYATQAGDVRVIRRSG